MVGLVTSRLLSAEGAPQGPGTQLSAPRWWEAKVPKSHGPARWIRRPPAPAASGKRKGDRVGVLVAAQRPNLCIVVPDDEDNDPEKLESRMWAEVIREAQET